MSKWLIWKSCLILPKKQWTYKHFYEFASKAIHEVRFESFLKSMTSCLLKFDADFWFYNNQLDNLFTSFLIWIWMTKRQGTTSYNSFTSKKNHLNSFGGLYYTLFICHSEWPKDKPFLLIWFQNKKNFQYPVDAFWDNPIYPLLYT